MESNQPQQPLRHLTQTSDSPFARGSDSSDNLDREERKDPPPSQSLNIQEYITNRLRDLLEQPLIDLAKKEISLNADLKVLQEKESTMREKTDLLLAKYS